MPDALLLQFLILSVLSPDLSPAAHEPPGRGLLARAFRRDVIIAVLAIVAVVDLLFTLNAAAQGHPPKWSHIPAEIVVYLVLSALTFALYVFMQVIERVPLLFRFLLILPACMACGALQFPIVRTIMVLMTDHSLTPWSPGMFTLRNIHAATWPYLFSAAGLLAFDYHQAVRERERQLLRNQAMMEEARRLALRYEINPHFLFNSLNSVSSLVLARDNAAAEEMLLRLAGFFRQTLESDGATVVPLRLELDMQQAYVEVEQARFGEDVALVVEVPDRLLDAQVPAMILQPLVENAIKHGASHPIGVTVAERDRMLVIEVENDVAGEATAEGTGTGIRNVRERLLAHFGADAALEVEASGTATHRARVVMPLIYGPTEGAAA